MSVPTPPGYPPAGTSGPLPKRPARNQVNVGYTPPTPQRTSQTNDPATSGPTAEMDALWEQVNNLESMMTEEQRQKLMYLRYVAQEYATRISPTGYGVFPRIVGYGQR